MEEKCCINCFVDIEIQSFIKDLDNISDCNYCASKQVNCGSLEEVGDFIREGIQRAYEPVYAGSGSIYDSETKSYTDEGEPLEAVLKWNLCIFSDSLDADRLCDDLISYSGPSHRDIQQGVDNWLDNENLVLIDALYGSEAAPQHSYWIEFKQICKYYNRFFDLGGQKSSRAKILSSLDDIFTSMTISLPKGTKLYRSRRFDIPGEYSCAAEPPVRCGVSHRSGLTEPQTFNY